MIEIKRSAFVLSSTKKFIKPGGATSIFLSQSGRCIVLLIISAVLRGFILALPLIFSAIFDEKSPWSD